MSEMVERVKAAIAEKMAPVFDARAPYAMVMFDLAARAAIAAMREPTAEMTSCCDEVHWGYSCYQCGGLQEGWQKMIDAALR